LKTLLALGCSSRLAVKEMNLLAQASELLLLLQESNLIHVRPGCGVPKLVFPHFLELERYSQPVAGDFVPVVT
jgi:hypothetical protein